MVLFQSREITEYKTSSCVGRRRHLREAPRHPSATINASATIPEARGRSPREQPPRQPLPNCLSKLVSMHLELWVSRLILGTAKKKKEKTLKRHLLSPQPTHSPAEPGARTEPPSPDQRRRPSSKGHLRHQQTVNELIPGKDSCLVLVITANSMSICKNALHALRAQNKVCKVSTAAAAAAAAAAPNASLTDCAPPRPSASS